MSTIQSKGSSLLFLLVAANCLLSVQSQQLFFGGCPSVTTMSALDINQYAGDWYENRKYFAIFELGQRCVKTSYSIVDGNIQVTNSGNDAVFGNSVTSTAEIQQLGAGGDLFISYSGSTNAPTESNYKVLGTDYSTYAVVWSCSDFILFNTQLLWVLTRDRKPCNEVTVAALSVIEQNGLSQSQLGMTDQSDCEA